MYSGDYLNEVSIIASRLSADDIEHMVERLVPFVDATDRHVFVIGLGGSAANASHAVNDLRKICRINAIAPTDNVAEFTARINDQGWDQSFVEWLRCSKLSINDALLVLSVGGGNLPRYTSTNIAYAIWYAKSVGAKVLGIVGLDDGVVADCADAYVLVPTVAPERITPHTEEFQSILLHLITSHPKLKA